MFVRTKQRVDRLVAHLTHDGFHAAGIHHLHTVAQRRRVVDRFREYVDEVNATEDKVVLLPRLQTRSAMPKEEIDDKEEDEADDAATETSDVQSESECKCSSLALLPFPPSPC